MAGKKDSAARRQAIEDRAEAFIETLSEVEDCREKSLAITKIEEAAMWAVKAIKD